MQYDMKKFKAQRKGGNCARFKRLFAQGKAFNN